MELSFGIAVIVELIGVVLEQLNIVEVHWSCPLALSLAKLNIVELIKGVVLEQLYIVKVHWSCPLALLCKVQSLPLAKQSGYTFKEAQNSSKHILYCWLFGFGCDILFSPYFQHHLYFILITAKYCKGKGNGHMIHCYLDTIDAKSTGNLCKHAKVCWEEEAVAAADQT